MSLGCPLLEYQKRQGPSPSLSIVIADDDVEISRNGQLKPEQRKHLKKFPFFIKLVEGNEGGFFAS